MLQRLERRLEGIGGRLHAADRQLARTDLLQQLLGLHAVLDQVLDGDDLQLVLRRELEQLRQTLDRAVVIDDFGEDADQLKAGEARQVGRRFGVAGARQHAAGARDQRKDVARAQEVVGAAIVVGEGARGVGAFLGRDAGGHADAVIDADGEGGAHRIEVVGHHRIEMQALRALGGHRHADDAAGVADHERHLLRRRRAGRHDEVALVLAVGVVDHDHQLSLAHGGDGVFDGVELHDRPGVVLRPDFLAAKPVGIKRISLAVGLQEAGAGHPVSCSASSAMRLARVAAAPRMAPLGRSSQ